jgi:hypothetical protein
MAKGRHITAKRAFHFTSGWDKEQKGRAAAVEEAQPELATLRVDHCLRKR